MGRREVELSLRLFVAGDSPDSAMAIANLEIEIVDVQREPSRAARDGITVTPTLLKVSPSPSCRILGNLKNRDALLHVLGLEPPRSDPSL